MLLLAAEEEAGVEDTVSGDRDSVLRDRGETPSMRPLAKGEREDVRGRF